MRSSIAASALLLLTACPADPGGEDENSDASSSGSSSSATPQGDTSGSVTDGTTGGAADTSEGSSEGSSGGGFPDPIADECIDDVSAGDHVYECGDFSYDVTIPPACLEQACGLIFDVHGFTMNGAMQEANTHMRERGAERGYIVVQPNANPAPPASSWNPGIDDGPVFDFMLRMADAFHVDRDRLHFTGFSQGGYMTWRAVCEHADVLASVAPAAACGADPLGDCLFTADKAPAESVDILFIHGTSDVLVPYACAPVRRDAVVAAYALGDEEVLTENEEYRWTRHTGDDGTVFEFITHEYAAANLIVLGGHCFPGSDDPGDATGQLLSYACVEPTDLHWGDTVLDFFDAHPRD